MGFKKWLAKHTAKPSDFASAYASGLIDLIDNLTASLIVFSGKRAPVYESPQTNILCFLNHFEMEQAGFSPFNDYITCLIAPSIEEVKKTADAGFLANTFQNTTAFLCLVSENAAREYMNPKNATQFSTALYYSVAERIVGKFGFRQDVREVRRTITELLPHFRSSTLLNIDSFGKGDSLELLTNQISLSPDRQTQYAFVVGSQKQPVGCATTVVSAVREIHDSIGRLAKDLRW